MRNVGLDVLRCLAVFLVIGQHLRTPPVGAPSVIHAWRNGGWQGVTIFFVLSGFLVSGLLFREYDSTGTIDTKRFLIRRGFKIYPGLWALIGSYLAVNFVLNKNGAPWATLRAAASELLFVQNYFPGLGGHTWTLAVEEHFYLILAATFGWLLLHNASKPFRRIPILFVLLAVACTWFRYLNVATTPAVAGLKWCGTHLTLDALFFGVLLSYLWRYRGLEQICKRLKPTIFIAFGAILLSPGFLTPSLPEAFAPLSGPVGYFASGLLVLGFAQLQQIKYPAWLPFAFLGTCSYSIYLWHGYANILAGRGLERWLGNTSWSIYFISYLFMTCIFGVVAHFLLEQPFLLLRDKWFPSRSRPAKPTELARFEEVAAKPRSTAVIEPARIN